MSNAHDRQRFAARKAAGICPDCALFDPLPGHVRCSHCMAKRRAAAARRRARERVDVDLECSACRSKQTESFHGDAFMADEVAKARCLFCGTKTMRRVR